MPPFTFDTFPELETERLLLRRILPTDAADWARLFGHPDVTAYLVDIEENAGDEAHAAEIIAWADEIFARRSGIRWAVTLKPEGRLIGSCGFHLYSAANRRAEIGYELHVDYWRRGIMTEALRAVLRFCFDALELHRVEADVTAGNQASAGLLRALGFVQEGTWRERVYARGQFHDLWQFGLLEREYRAR